MNGPMWSRHGTISNFWSISISIFSEIWFSKSISISKFFQKILQYQNQYQNFSKPRINIKININIVKILVLILKIKIFWGLKIWFLTSSDLCRLGPMGFHLIPIAPKQWNLKTLFRTKGTQSETHDTPPVHSISPKLLLG